MLYARMRARRAPRSCVPTKPDPAQAAEKLHSVYRLRERDARWGVDSLEPPPVEVIRYFAWAGVSVTPSRKKTSSNFILHPAGIFHTRSVSSQNSHIGIAVPCFKTRDSVVMFLLGEKRGVEDRK